MILRISPFQFFKNDIAKFFHMVPSFGLMENFKISRSESEKSGARLDRWCQVVPGGAKCEEHRLFQGCSLPQSSPLDQSTVPQASLAPAFPVVLLPLSGFSPKSSISAWTTMALPTTVVSVYNLAFVSR